MSSLELSWTFWGTLSRVFPKAAMVPAHVGKSTLASFRAFSVVPSIDFLPTGGIGSHNGVEDMGVVGGPKRASTDTLSRKDCVH